MMENSSKMEIDDEDGETLPVVLASRKAQTPVIDDEDIEKGVQLYNPEACTPNEVAENA